VPGLSLEDRSTEQPSVFTFASEELLAEYHRRHIAIGHTSNAPRINPDKVRELAINILKYEQHPKC